MVTQSSQKPCEKWSCCAFSFAWASLGATCVRQAANVGCWLSDGCVNLFHAMQLHHLGMRFLHILMLCTLEACLIAAEEESLH